MGSREVHSNRGHAHHAATAFAVVHCTRHFAAAVLQRGEAGSSRSAATEKFFLLEQPAEKTFQSPRSGNYLPLRAAKQPRQSDACNERQQRLWRRDAHGPCWN